MGLDEVGVRAGPLDEFSHLFPSRRAGVETQRVPAVRRQFLKLVSHCRPHCVNPMASKLARVSVRSKAGIG